MPCSPVSFAESKSRQEDDTGIITLQEEDENLVQAMIDYLYNHKFTTTTIADISDRAGNTCSHGGNDHSCLDQTCYMWPCGFAIAMHAMGDKYDIPGLRIYSRGTAGELGQVLDPTGKSSELWSLLSSKLAPGSVHRCEMVFFLAVI